MSHVQREAGGDSENQDHRRTVARPVAAKVSLLVPPSGGNFAGIERVTFTLAVGLADRGLDVDLVLMEPLPGMPEAGPGVRRVDLSPGTRTDGSTVRDLLERFLGLRPAGSRLLTCGIDLVRYFRWAEPAVVVAPQVSMTAVAAIAGSISRKRFKLISVLHGNVQVEGRRSRKSQWLYSLTYRLYRTHVDRVVSVSKELAALFVEESGLEVEPQVVYNPVVGPELRRTAREPVDHSWLAHKTEPVVLGVGRLHPQKDFPTLIRAFAQLRRARDARLLILGEGPARDDLEALVGELSLQRHVELPGYVDNPLPFMRDSDVFVLSSAWEGFGNVLVEALSVGTPVVTTDCPTGPREILEDGRWGRLVPVGDVEGLAHAIAETLHAEVDGEALRERAKAFGHQRSVDAYFDLILGVLTDND